MKIIANLHILLINTFVINVYFSPHYVILSMDLINKNIGEKIKSRRLRLGYSQLMLSELAHVSRDQISRIESGKINFTLATLFKICRALRIKPHKLLKDAEQEEYFSIAKRRIDSIKANT